MAGRKRRTPSREHRLRKMAVFLRSGHDIFNDFQGRDPTLSELREAWNLLKDELMAAAPLGTRPWGWWRFERVPAKARKLRLDYLLEDRVILKRFGLLSAAEQEAIREEIESRWALRNEIRMEEARSGGVL